MKRIFHNHIKAMHSVGVLGLIVIMILAGFTSAQQNLIGDSESIVYSILNKESTSDVGDTEASPGSNNVIKGSSSNPSFSGSQPLSPGPEYTALPDRDPDSGKFLGVAGSGTLTDIPIVCHIGVPEGEINFDLDVFDGDIGGHWDQYYDNLDDLEFKLYEDPLKDGSGSNLVALWTEDAMIDDGWYLRTFPTTSGAQAPSGNYFYRLEVQWDNPGVSSNNNYFKIRTTGQISITGGVQFAFMGAPLRLPPGGDPYFGQFPLNPPWEALGMDPPIWAGDPNPDPDINDVDANSYDGDWRFYFYIPKTTTLIEFKDGDADYVNDFSSPGAPQDGPSPYDGCNIDPSIYYKVTDPDGVSYNNYDPSGNLEWETFSISGTLPPGLWDMHWKGVDAHNMNFIEAMYEIYQTPDPPLPVNVPPTLVPSWTTTVEPDRDVNFAHTLTNKGAPDTFDLTATSSEGWTTKIYYDEDGDEVLDPSEISAGEISDTSVLATNASFKFIVQVHVPSGSGDTTDYTTVTASSQTEWNIQASVTDTMNVIANEPPVADANGPYNCDEGDTIQLDGSGSYDPDGDYIWYFWDLDDDGFFDDSTEIKPTVTYSEDGTFTVKLRVYDGEYYDTATTTVNVANKPPEIYSSTYVYTLTQGSTTQTIPAVEKAQTAASFYNYYSASSHTGFEKAYESKVFLYRDINTDEISLIITHDIDDGPSGYIRVDFDLSGIPSGAYVAQSDDPSHAWDPPRTQEFSLDYPDMEGHWMHTHNTDGGVLGGLPTDSSWAITITPLYWYDINSWVYHYASGESITLDMDTPITIAYEAQTEPTTLETDEGTAITLGAFARDWGSDDDPLDYKFEWNDPYDSGAASSGTTPWDTLFTAVHTYYEDGTYYPLLTVTDSDGATDTLTFTVIVNNVAPDVDAGSDRTIDEGTSLSVSGSFSDPGAYDTHTGSWDWGDSSSSSGTVTEETVPPYSTGTVSGSHTYMDHGTYTVVLTVEDDDGAAGRDSITVTVLDLAPEAEFTWTPKPQDEGSPVQFTDNSTSYPDAIASWEWDFDGLGNSSDQNPQFTFMDDGVYTVTLKVTDDDGSSDSVSHDITILDLKPNADFSWSPEPQDEGSPVQFIDLSTSYPDVIVSWKWDFGDGGTSDLQSPSHTYGDNDVYEVTLIVTDDDNSTDTTTYNITIRNVAPIVDAGENQTTDEGTLISFSGNFSDPGWLDTHTILWDFGDGNTASGTLTPTHAYGDDGVYIVSLTVTDDDGGVGYDEIAVIVYNVAPNVISGNDQTIDEGNNVTFYVASFTDPGWLDTHTATIDWGDGTVDDGVVSESGGNGTVFGSHVYGDNGVYTVTVTVTDDDDGVGYATLNITVNNVAPTIKPFGPFSFDEGSPFNLSATSTDVGSDDLTFKWEFQLGPTIVNIYYNDGMSPDPYPSPWGTFPFSATDIVGHTYGDNGVYTVTLTVMDDDNGTATFTTNITVNNVVPAIEPFGPFTVDEGSPLNLSAKSNDVGSDDLTFTWEFQLGLTITNIHYNDGVASDPYPSPMGTFPFSATDLVIYTYGDNGIYTLNLTVEDDDGGAITFTTNITVNNVAPTIEPFGPFSVDEGSPLNITAISSDQGSDDLTFTWQFQLGPMITNAHFNDDLGPDPFPSPGGIYPFSAADTVSHTYGDNGVFQVTLSVEDDDGAVTTYNTNITVNNVAPEVVNLKAYMYVNFTLRVAGEKWHSVGLYLYEDDEEISSALVTRYPGNPDEQTGTIANVKLDLTKSYSALVDYLPNDPRENGNVWGANPVWLILTFEDGSETRIHHTFNVRKSYWNSDHWNHIDPWEVDITPYLGGHNITFEANATDVGSDDLTFLWDFGDGNYSGPNTYFNNGISPDPFPSPEVNPMTATDTAVHSYSSSGNYTITLTVVDDDGGTTIVTLVLGVVVG